MTRRLKLTLKIALVSFALLLGLLVGALLLLLYHPAAPQWALDLARQATPMNIEVDSLSGRLAGPLRVEGLRLQDDRVTVRVETIELDWRPMALLGGELHLLRLATAGLSVTLQRQDPQAESATQAGNFEGISLPLAVRVDELELTSLEVQLPDSEPLQIDRFSLEVRAEQGRLDLRQLVLLMPQLELHAQGELGLQPSQPSSLHLNWRLTLPERAALEGGGQITGDLQRLQISQTLSGALTAQLEATVEDPAGDLSWDLQATLQPSQLGEWLQTLPLTLSGKLGSRGTPERIGLEADLALSQPDYGDASLSLRGDYSQGRFQAEKLQLTTSAGSRVEGSGHYTPDEELGSFAAELAWQDLRWPLQGDEVQVQSSQGKLKLGGVPKGYDFTLEANLQHLDTAAAKVDASGRGDLQGVDLQQLSAVFDPDRLQGSGRLTWAPALEWQFQLTGSELDPSRWLAGLPGRIELAATTQGSMGEAGLDAQFHLQRLQGQVRDYPVKAQGDASFAQQALRIDSLWLTSGDNRIEAQGVLAQELALNWRIDAPQLQGLWPGLEGALRGNGQVVGSPEVPRLVAELSGQGLSFENNRVETLQLSADLAFAAEQALSLDLRAGGLKSDAMRWQSFGLQLTGSASSHRLNLSLKGDDAPSLDLSADGGWKETQLWQGKLRSLVLSLPQQPAWTLTKAAPFALGAGRQQLDQLCLARDGATLCSEFRQAPRQGWRALLEARQFPLVTLQPWLPEGLQIKGRGELQAQLAAVEGGRMKGELQLQLPEGGVGFDLTKAQERIDFAGGELQGVIDDKGGRLQLTLPMAGLGRVEGQVNLPGFDSLVFDTATQTLQGELNIDLKDLSRLSLITPRIQNPGGEIRGELTLAGTLGQPQLRGNVELKSGSLDVPELGLELRDIVLAMRAPTLDQLELQGEMRSGKGQLKLGGSVELDAQAGFPATLRLTGKKMTVANVPEAEVLVTPDLTIKRDRESMRLEGRIEIPYARLRPRKLPASAVTATPDLVVVGSEKPQKVAFDPQFSAEVRVVLGDRVSFDGFGLRGKLSGSLLVVDEPKRPVIGRGRVGVVDGTYRAYGQDLKIERGFANFVDSPVDNPGLDVKAVREVGDVTAGVRVGGTLKTPRIDLFSSPAMAESDILSYLLTGRPPGEGGGETVGIAAALKATGAGTVADELGRQFGLEELRLDAGSGLEEASVVAGTYLSPRLYVQYVNELASRETKLRLRYDINKRLQLEAETGRTQGADLYYTFDR